MRVLTRVAGQGYVDGCFSDRSDGTPCGGGEDYIQGHVQVHKELQKKLGNGPLIANRKTQTRSSHSLADARSPA